MLDRGLGFWRRTDWLARTATTAAVTLVAVGVTVAAPGEPGHRRVDLLAVGVLLVASLAVGAAGQHRHDRRPGRRGGPPARPRSRAGPHRADLHQDRGPGRAPGPAWNPGRAARLRVGWG